MRIADWARQLNENPGLSESLATLANLDSQDSATWSPIAVEARPVVLAALHHQQPRKTLIVTPTYERALHWQAKLQLCGVPASDIRQLPSGLVGLFQDSAPESVALSDRIGALQFLIEPGPGFVISTPQSVLERTIPREVMELAHLDLTVGESVDVEGLRRTLQMLGYELSDPVRTPGQVSIRGGIVDIFAMGHEVPVRIELFGDEIESIRQFDPLSQRSIGPVKFFRLMLSRETIYPLGPAQHPDDDRTDAEILGQYSEMIRRAMEQEGANLTDAAAATLEETITGDARNLEAGVFFDRLDLYRPLLHPESGCAVDLLGEDGRVVLDDANEIEMIAHRAEEELGDALGSRAQRGEILHSTPHDFVQGVERLGAHGRLIVFTSIQTVPRWIEAPAQIEFEIDSLESYRGRPEVLATTLKGWIADGYQVALGTDQPNRAKSVLSQIEVFESEGFQVVQGNLAGGFIAQKAKVALITDHELFGVGRLKLPQRRFNEGIPVETVLDLKPGDYVVHINFGIGVYQGLVKRAIDGVEKEFLFVQYAAPDKLYVPADQLDRIQKYLNPGETDPKLNRLTGGEWQRAVGKAREEAREFARDLIKLYAQRRQVQRPSFGPDSPWQAEMETTFPWVETPSQMQAIRDTKADLKLDYPMDRLICGDVGFGKTEVAIRAAFKVAQAGRQVAVLCPTTILSEQHYRNFAERLAAFPTRVELINRFRSAADRREVLNAVEHGEVDILIGTHALLSQQVKFKDLGIVIIDEEQKFGVKQKEALKTLRVNVDVLSMSATPIPRTLSMALMDVRQMSLINDPPPGRLPIRTYVRPHSDEVVREAILRELNRGGQVYYVYNRVQGIYHIAEKLRKLIPQARIGVGHGQMTEKELEPIMIGFIKGEIDVLLSTTIIENGLDIPNANTMIVDHADRLGMSQLYQLRGRVGRSDRQAYAYFMYAGQGSLTENAMARLEALQDFSHLGSGYSLAFRDLQIRGAGELLGARQSGTMASVGYELFTQIINEEIHFLKTHAEGGEAEYRDPLERLTPLPTVDLPTNALIPEAYIIDQGQRLYYYQQIMSSRTVERLTEIEVEMSDRYGRPPEEVARIFQVMRVRLVADAVQMEKVDGHGGRLAVSFRESAELPPRLWTLLNKRNRECYLSRQQFIWPFTGDVLTACERMIAAVRETLEQIEAERAALSG